MKPAFGYLPTARVIRPKTASIATFLACSLLLLTLGIGAASITGGSN